MWWITSKASYERPSASHPTLQKKPDYMGVDLSLSG
jgi:hypothetical protein